MDTMDNSLVSKLVNSNLDVIISNIVPLIEKDYARTAVLEVLDRLKSTVAVLTDGDKNNKAQLDLIWGTVLSDPQLIEAVRSALLDAISKVEDQKIKEGLSLLISPLVQTLVAVSDKTPNKDQLKQIWVDFVESPEFLAFVISNLGWILSKVIKDQATLNFINRILTALIK
jgi:hypothetical protein